eukprot:5479280-Pleurochrysis_carterae.AAC.1
MTPLISALCLCAMGRGNGRTSVEPWGLLTGFCDRLGSSLVIATTCFFYPPKNSFMIQTKWSRNAFQGGNFSGSHPSVADVACARVGARLSPPKAPALL